MSQHSTKTMNTTTINLIIGHLILLYIYDLFLDGIILLLLFGYERNNGIYQEVNVAGVHQQ
jgi:hypothetical protein